jgi:hypothetical protein
MQATYEYNGKTTIITGKSLKDLRRKLGGMLKIEGPRGLTANVKTGAAIHVELYEGQDYIRTANGRIIK